jgi:hypothetical protein
MGLFVRPFGLFLLIFSAFGANLQLMARITYLCLAVLLLGLAQNAEAGPRIKGKLPKHSRLSAPPAPALASSEKSKTSKPQKAKKKKKKVPKAAARSRRPRHSAFARAVRRKASGDRAVNPPTKSGKKRSPLTPSPHKPSVGVHINK